MNSAQRGQIAGAVKTPFYFNTAEHVLRVEGRRPIDLVGLLEELKLCSQESIFQHTFRTLQQHHFIQEGYSNDFAHWALVSCNESELAERLSSVDVREFTSLSSLRDCLVQVVEEYLAYNPAARNRRAAEPFYFCSSGTVVLPTSVVARNLTEFREALEYITVHSVHYHFIEARVRLKLNTNDFSVWLEQQMGLSNAAELINRIDFYTLTLQGVRNRILRIVEAAQPEGN
jgi:Family of unknown function (DUF5752)